MKFLAPLLLLILLFDTRKAVAAAPNDLHAYVAFGNNYTFPGALRVGWNEWEFGQISMGVYGAVKRNFLVRHSYMLFGPVVIGTTAGTGFGFTAGMGFDFLLFWKLGLRGEILGLVEHQGFLGARGNLGVSIDF